MEFWCPMLVVVYIIRPAMFGAVRRSFPRRERPRTNPNPYFERLDKHVYVLFLYCLRLY